MNTTWQYTNWESWVDLVDEKSLIIGKGGPHYPRIVKVKQFSKDNGQFEDFVGDYKILEEQYKNKPIWKNDKLGKFIFNEEEEDKEYSFKLNLESQWYIGDEIGQIDNSSIELYGWLYSDESYIWPNYSILYIANYPKMLTLLSEGPTKELFISLVGTYKMIPGLTNMRPRWKHNLRDIYFFYAATYNWQFLDGEGGGSLNGKEHSDSTILFSDNDEWELKINGNTYEDNSITITEGPINYPENITLNSFDGTKAQWPFLSGLFQKIEDLEKAERPIWKHVSINYYLFFDDYRTSWMIGPSYLKIDNRNIQSTQTVELDSDKTQWYFQKYSNGTYKWTYDETLSLIKGHPSYPDVIQVFQDDDDNLFVGNYEREHDKYYNEKPFFKKGDYYVFCDQKQWFIGERLGNTNSTKVYGWEYSDESSIWPNNNTFHIMEYPERLNISSTGAVKELFADKMGIYNIMPDVINSGRPVWKHSSNNMAYLYYVGQWEIGSTIADYSTKIFRYYDPRYEIKIPESGWVYIHKFNWYNDTSLVVQSINF